MPDPMNGPLSAGLAGAPPSPSAPAADTPFTFQSKKKGFTPPLASPAASTAAQMFGFKAAQPFGGPAPAAPAAAPQAPAPPAAGPGLMGHVGKFADNFAGAFTDAANNVGAAIGDTAGTAAIHGYHALAGIGGKMRGQSPPQASVPATHVDSGPSPAFSAPSMPAVSAAAPRSGDAPATLSTGLQGGPQQTPQMVGSMAPHPAQQSPDAWFYEGSGRARPGSLEGHMNMAMNQMRDNSYEGNVDMAQAYGGLASSLSHAMGSHDVGMNGPQANASMLGAQADWAKTPAGVMEHPMGASILDAQLQAGGQLAGPAAAAGYGPRGQIPHGQAFDAYRQAKYPDMPADPNMLQDYYAKHASDPDQASLAKSIMEQIQRGLPGEGEVQAWQQPGMFGFGGQQAAKNRSFYGSLQQAGR